MQLKHLSMFYNHVSMYTWVVSKVRLDSSQIASWMAVLVELVLLGGVVDLVDGATLDVGANSPRLAQVAPLQSGNLEGAKCGRCS